MRYCLHGEEIRTGNQEGTIRLMLDICTLCQARQPLMCGLTGLAVSCEDIIKGDDVLRADRLHDFLNHGWNRGKWHSIFKKGLYRYFVRCVQYCRRTTAGRQCLVCKAEAGETHKIGSLKIQPRY